MLCACGAASGADSPAGTAPDAVPPALREKAGIILRGTNEAERAEALDALDRMGAEALPLAPVLVAELAREAAPRWLEEESRAVLALDAIGDPAVEGLLRVAADAGHPARAGAIRALGRIKHEHAVACLAAALGDADAEVRRSAAWALGKMDNDAAAPRLAAALGHPDPETRRLAAWGLGKTGGEGAVEALIGSLRDERAEVRSAAAAALGNLGRGRALEPLRALLADPDPQVARCAAGAIRDIEQSLEREHRERQRRSAVGAAGR
jgi:HEAT repeat protein